ncbi:alpha-hydroxy acid oxidase [Alkalilacustris brevis]|uniref:alpha-hydroxy acid oxidase n=1 Tax=Alkalilacustris brevis TaxID=2026338 RepID=UPI000E0D7915|nr:alpha-hydroxy acid oxidase [Alkalilacustris brevis]
MPVICTIDDLRALYARRVPRMFRDYAESGSWSEQTLHDNDADFARIRLRQRVAVDMSDRRLASTMAGQEVAMPIALAPIGLCGMQTADGEIKAARAAEAAGVPFTLSTMSVCSIEDVAAHVTRPFWFQLYVMKDTDFVARLMARARAAGCETLVLTLDMQMLGQRHRDIRNGLSTPPRLTPRVLADLALRWRWGLGMLGTKRRHFGNIVGHAEGVSDTRSLASWTAEQFDLKLDWDKIARLRDQWGGRLVLKGILDAEDAEKAAQIGAEAIVVSNHGGRQLDGALSAIRVLPSVVAAVGGRTEVHLDGGIRSGQDALKALALGARGVYLGRAYVYGLGALGQAGVTQALDIVRRELDMTMALCGERRVQDLGRHNLILPRDFCDSSVAL